MCLPQWKANSSIWRAYQDLEGGCWAAERAFSDCLWCVLLYQVANPLLHLQLLVRCFPYSAIKLKTLRGYTSLALTFSLVVIAYREVVKLVGTCDTATA